MMNVNSLMNELPAMHSNKIAINTSTQQSAESKLATELDKEVTNPQEIKTIVDKMNQFIDPLRTNLKFELHEALNEYYVTVINPLTNEVIKEVPPKKMLDMYAAMAEFMGILIDKKI